MTVVLLADRDGSAFGELGSHTVPALMPLQSVPMLEHAFEAVFKAGVRAALLVVGPDAAAVERRFGKGIRWGLALEYVRREEDESVGDVLRRMEPRLDGETLVMRTDVGAHAAIGEFVREAEDRKEPVLSAERNGKPAGLWRLAPGTLKKIDLPREPASPDWAFRPGDAKLALSADFALIDSIAAYRKADRADKPAVSPRANVDPKAVLEAGATVAEETTVLPLARLRETSVLPGTVIPRGVSLANAVVAANLVLDAVSGQASRLSDLLPARSARSAGAGFGSRLAGAAAFLLSLPLWPVAFGWGLLANAGHATRPGVLVGCAPGTDGEGRPNRAPFKTFFFETAVPVLRDLPLLMAVASGRLALQGVEPLTPTEESALKEPWEKARLEAPPALLSRARLDVPASAPPEVARLVDSFEARLGVSGLLGPGLKALFSASGWTAPRVWNPDALPEGS